MRSIRVDILIHPSAQSERCHCEQEDRSDYSSILYDILLLLYTKV